MDPQLEERLKQIEMKLDATYISAEKTRKYFMWMLIASLIFIILPLIASVFIVPVVLQQMSSLYAF